MENGKKGVLIKMKAKLLILVGIAVLFSLGCVSASVWEGLNAYWDFDANGQTTTNAISRTGNYNLTTGNYGSLTIESGKVGNAAYFNGSTCIWGGDILDEDGTNRTYAFWIKNTQTTRTHIFSKYQGSGVGYYILQAIGIDNYSIGHSYPDITSTSGINDGDWHFVVITLSTDGNKIYIDGVLNNSNSNALEDEDIDMFFSMGCQCTSDDCSSRQNYYIGYLDEIGVWNRTLSADEVEELYNGGNGTGYLGESFLIFLNYPPNSATLSTPNITFNASYYVTGYNLTNATLYIWKSSDLFATNFTEITGTVNETIWEMDGFTLGNYEWNVYACANNSIGDICKWVSFNYTFSIGATIDEESWNNETYETKLENFSANITLLEDSILYDVKLIYNGTEKEVNYTAIDEDSYNLFSSFYVPAVDSDIEVSWYWSIYYDTDGGIITQNLTERTQLIRKIPYISVSTTPCGAGFFTSINYSFEDSENKTNLTADVDYNFKFGLGNLTSYVVNGEESNISNLYVCINKSIGDYKLGYGEIQYSKAGYSARRYYMFEGQELSNSTTAKHILYLIPSSVATSFIIEVKNTYLNPYTNKLVALLRWYPEDDEYKVVEMGKTDENGQTVMKVHAEDVDYRVGVYNLNGSLIKLADPVRMTCLVTPCTYSLKILHTTTDYFYEYGIESNLSFDETNNRFVFIWNDPSQTTTRMRLYVVKETGYQSITICNETAEGYVGVLTCNIENNTGIIRARAFKDLNPEIIFAEIVKEIRTSIESNIGLFAGFVLSLAAALIGLFSPIASIIMLFVGLIPSVIFGTITLEMFFGIGALGGIIIHFIKKSKAK